MQKEKSKFSIDFSSLHIDPTSLRQLRAKKGWNRDTLAEKSKVSRRTIDDLEIGKRKSRWSTVYKLAKALDVQFEDLLKRMRSDDEQYFLKEIQKTWIDGVLTKVQKEHDQCLIGISLEYQPELLEPSPVKIDDHSLPLSSDDLIAKLPEFGRSLVIAGAPGSGKTTILLRLMNRLLKDANKDVNKAIPVIFFLSSWSSWVSLVDSSESNSKKLTLFRDWLIDELFNMHEVPKPLGKKWIIEGKILPLLDGLDRVPLNYRAACVKAINLFRSEIPPFGPLSIVLCTRPQEYKELPIRLNYRTALLVRPLSRSAIENYLEKHGGAVSNLNAELLSKKQLWRFIDTPLMLNILLCIYKTPLRRSVQITDNKDRIRFPLFHKCIKDKLFQDNSTSSSCYYDSQEAFHWLKWLANLLQDNGQTILHLERIKPDWLSLRSHKEFIIFGALLISGLSVGILMGFSMSITLKSEVALLTGVLFGIFGPLLFWAFGYGRDIKPVETLSWSPKTIIDRPKKRFLGALLFAATFGLFFLIAGGPILGYVVSLLSGLMFIVFFEVPGRGLDKERLKIPNEGIRRSLRSAIKSAIIGGIPFVIIFTLSFGVNVGILMGIGFGLVMGLLNGGHGCIQHLILRAILKYNGFAPWNYIRFLDYASERSILYKVGGGYKFANDLFMEYFAKIDEPIGGDLE